MNNNISDVSDIIILRGAPASGKSQTAKCLSKYFSTGVRLEIDTLRSMVISVNWINQDEHVNILKLSINLVHGFIKLGFRPVIVVDTFSSGKLSNYLDDLHKIDINASVRIFGLFASENEIHRRVQLRKTSEFRDFDICRQLNNEVMHKIYAGEYQIDTTGLMAKDTASLIIKYLQNPIPHKCAQTNRELKRKKTKIGAIKRVL
jgi:hypothetical protein